MSSIDELIPLIVKKVIDELSEDKRYKYAVPIGISNRHVHLKKSDLDILFGKGYELTKLKDLKQTGEYACEETVTLISMRQGKEKHMDQVRILGPLRPETQIEISQTEARAMKLNPPVRNSGDLRGSEGIVIEGPKGRIHLDEGCIIATRHVHMSPEDAKRLNLESGDIVSVHLSGEKPGRIDTVHCKVHKNYVLELHLDTDDGNAFRLKTGDMATIVLPD